MMCPVIYSYVIHLNLVNKNTVNRALTTVNWATQLIQLRKNLRMGPAEPAIT